MEEAVNLLTIADLVRRGRPLTATFSLNSSPTPSSKSKSTSANKIKSPGLATDSNRNHKIITPLTRPSILVGTLTLSTETLKCPNKHCFQFSDNSSAICCDILDFSVRVIGMTIHVLAWNFIPFKHSGGGFLEIIKWNSPESNVSYLSRCSTIDSMPITSSSVSQIEHKSKSKSCYFVHGPIESIGPVSLVPCSIGGSKSNNVLGFIVRIMICECKLCNCKESVTILHNLGQEQHNPHSFIKPVFIYFFGSPSWHPVITKLVGNVVVLSGLKKKLVFMGKDESQLMFVTTENSFLHFPRVSKKWSPFSRNVVRGKGECGAYTGVVNGVYMQGMVIELDKEVWLLLTDQLLVMPHSLRVGAIITLRNVHFVNPKFIWTQMLILGACFKTSLTVESFSPLETGCCIVSQSQSQLEKFIGSLTFSARLWALLVISCFRKKFAGILSEKEILGSKHKKGLAQLFTSSHLPPSVIRARHGVLTELCKHDSCGCSSEPYCANLKLVAPISMFLHHCEAMWMRERNSHNTKYSLFSCEGSSHSLPLRRIFQSEDIGVSLLGSLKISPSSRRLQLVDATGSIDVIIPDLPSTWKSNGIYEVVRYSIVMEGALDLVEHPGLSDSESFSCRHVFCCTPWARELYLTIYIYFHLSNATCKSIPIYPCVVENLEFKELQGGRFHLIWVAHKYPMLQKFQGELAISDNSSTFAEAVVLPWDLFLDGHDGTVLPVKFSEDCLREPLTQYSSENYQEHLSNKKHKINQLSSQAFKGSTDRQCAELSSLEIPCLANVRSANCHNFFSPGKLCFTKCKVKIGADCKPSTEKLLLEFNSENFLKYQLLQIGSYYIIQHHPEESFCSVKDCNSLSGIKVFISSTTHFWSLSFSSDEVIPKDRPSSDPSQDDSCFSRREVLIRDQVELHVKSTKNFREPFSDVSLHLSANALSFLEAKVSETKEVPVGPLMTPEKTLSDSSGVLNMTSFSGFSSGSLAFTHFFPEGNLISVRGDVVGIHDFDCNSANTHLSCERLDVCHMRFLRGSANSTCIHVLVDNQMVTIFGFLSKHAHPVGFGPGVNATFCRILKMRETNRLKLIPVSYICMNSISVPNESYVDKSFKIQSSLYLSSAASLDNVPSGMISELIQCKDCKLMQFNCRVLAVHVLVLEKNKKYHDLHSEVQRRPHFVDIPLVGFVLDDGSSTCCCWADAERATTLLRLHEEFPMRAFESSGCTLKRAGTDKSCWKNTMFHLERILRKHDRIILRNYGSMIDYSHQDLTVSVNSDNILSSSDENLLKFIVLNACFGTFWTVVASAMDANVVMRLEKEHLTQMEMRVLPLQHVWAIEVHYLNTLTEARKMIQEMLDRH